MFWYLTSRPVCPSFRYGIILYKALVESTNRLRLEMWLAIFVLKLVLAEFIHSSTTTQLFEATMSPLLSLLTVLLFVFDGSLVAARPSSLQFRSPNPVVDVSGLNTNAKRFSRGLPPIPPLFKRKPTGIDSAPNLIGLLTARKKLIFFSTPSCSKVHGFFVRVRVLATVARMIFWPVWIYRKSGVIEVFNAHTNQLQGYVSKTLKTGQYVGLDYLI